MLLITWLIEAAVAAKRKQPTCLCAGVAQPRWPGSSTARRLAVIWFFAGLVFATHNFVRSGYWLPRVIPPALGTDGDDANPPMSPSQSQDTTATFETEEKSERKDKKRKDTAKENETLNPLAPEAGNGNVDNA